MQLCNISLRQRGEHSVALKCYVVARPASNTPCYSALTQKLRQNTSYLHLGGMNKLALRGHDNVCSMVQYLQYGMVAPFVPTWLRA